MQPSIFQYATKELSQDAFFCWLLSWSDEKYKNTDIHKVAKSFLQEIIREEISVEKILIKQQYKKIDFYIRLNECITIVFEDKVSTTFHGDQLEKYYYSILEEYPDDRLYFVYIKTDLVFEEERKEVESYGYTVYDIFKVRKLLQKEINNDIYRDFLLFIDGKIKSYTDFELIEFSEWQQAEWIGFCNKLQNDLEVGSIGFWTGRELFYQLSVSDQLFNKDIYTSLEIKHSIGNNDGRLAILLHIGDGRFDKYKLKNKIKEKIIETYKSEKKQINNRVGKLINLATFESFPIIENGYVNYQLSKDYVSKIYKVHDKIKY